MLVNLKLLIPTAIASGVAICFYADYPILKRSENRFSIVQPKIIQKQFRFLNSYQQNYDKNEIEKITGKNVEIRSWRPDKEEWIQNKIIENSVVVFQGYRGSFRNLVFKNCHFDSFVLEKSDVYDCQFINCTVEFRGSMDKQGFSNCVFDGSIIKLNSSRFGDEGSHVSSCSFKNANLETSYVEREAGMGVIQNCNFENANLRNSRFIRVCLKNDNFRNADLSNTEVGSIINCSFRGANVQGMKVTGYLSPSTYALLWMKGTDMSKSFLSQGL